MATLILGQADVRALLPMAACMELMSEALQTLARGEGSNPLRSAMPLAEGRGVLGMMPGQLGAPPALGIKVITVMPGNHGTPFDSHQGLVVLFDPAHGSPLAILDASEITAVRTAAVSGVATRALAREEAGDLAILGSGVQARTHLDAMLQVRPIRRARVYSPTRANREAFAEGQARRHGVEVLAVGSAREAVEGADIICAVTSAREPVLEGAWIAPGAHINAVGACFANAREIDTEGVSRSRLFVDRRESALNEAGDLLIPRGEGALGDDFIRGELGEVLLGRVAGREDPDAITLFKSLGLAVEDLAVGRYLYERAREEGVGVSVELGGLRARD